MGPRADTGPPAACWAQTLDEWLGLVWAQTAADVIYRPKHRSWVLRQRNIVVLHFFIGPKFPCLTRGKTQQIFYLLIIIIGFIKW